MSEEVRIGPRCSKTTERVGVYAVSRAAIIAQRAKQRNK